MPMVLAVFTMRWAASRNRDRPTPCHRREVVSVCFRSYSGRQVVLATVQDWDGSRQVRVLIDRLVRRICDARRRIWAGIAIYFDRQCKSVAAPSTVATAGCPSSLRGATICTWRLSSSTTSFGQTRSMSSSLPTVLPRRSTNATKASDALPPSLTVLPCAPGLLKPRKRQSDYACTLAEPSWLACGTRMSATQSSSSSPRRSFQVDAQAQMAAAGIGRPTK